MLGFHLFLREYATVADMIGFTPIHDGEHGRLLRMGLEPQRFLRAETVSQRLANAGIPSYVLIKSIYKESPLSKMFYNGSKAVHGFVNSSDMFVTLKRLVTQNPDERSCIMVYWDAIDSISHVYGANSEAFAAEVRNLSYSLEREFMEHVDSQISGTTLLILTADHGQVTVPDNRLVRVDRHSKIRDNLLLPPTGDFRAAYLYAKQGKLDALRAYMDDQLSDQMVTIPSSKALSSGLWGYGDVHLEVPERMGNLVAIMRDNYAFYSSVKEKPYYTGGKHGGLTPDEMLIPFLCVRLG